MEKISNEGKSKEEIEAASQADKAKSLKMNADISHEIDGEYSMKFDAADATMKSPVKLEQVGDN